MRAISQLLLFGFLAVSPTLTGQKSQQILNDWLQDESLKHASVGVQFTSLGTGKTLATHNAELALIPASNMKLITSSCALNLLGPEHRFQTELKYNGSLSNGILDSDLIIKGGGDPSLGSTVYGGYETLLTSWVKAVEAAGIKQIKGYILLDVSIFPPYTVPRTWIWEDIGNYYGAGISGLTFYDNTYFISFKTSSTVGAPSKITQIKPSIPGLKHENKVVSNSSNRDLAYVFGGPGQFERRIEGSLPKGRSNFTIKASMPDPGFFLGVELRKRLVAKGIIDSLRPVVVQESATGSEANVSIHSKQSPTLGQLLIQVNQKSNNLYAEHVFRHLALIKNTEAKPELAVRAVEEYHQQAGIFSGGLNMVDGSGMSRFNTVSVRNLTEMLIHMQHGKYSTQFETTLAVAGKSGTFKSFLRGTRLEGKVIGKSGYMERVRSYSGYMDVAGERVAFSIIVNNYSCSAGAMKKKIEQLLLDMTAQ